MGGSITFRGAELVLPGGVEAGDLVIEDGRIAAIGAGVAPRGEVVDARGLALLPGVIDPQVHFREPGPTHKEDLATGSAAAAAGGVTAFLEMPNTDPPTTSRTALEDKLRRAAGRATAHYGFFLGATPDNFDEVAAARDVPGIKIFMGSSTGTLLVDDEAALDRHFAVARVPIAVHAEDEARLRERKRLLTAPDPALHPVIRDEEAALIATRRAIALAERHRRRLHVLHLSTAEEADLLRRRPRDGLVTSETLPQFLFLDARLYATLGTRLQMNPPVREARHGEALWAALLDGTIDCLATDHAPHTLEEKARPYGEAPSGMPGVETSLPLMLDAVSQGRCTLRHIARWMCEGPARCYGLVGKGRLEVGYDGDVTLVDLKRARVVRGDELFTKVKWSPFEGWTLRGWPVMTVLRGRPVFRDGAIVEGVFGEPLHFASLSQD